MTRTDTLVFAPVGIAHLTHDNVDLLRHAVAGKSCIRVTTAAQVNGRPHLGTVLTVLTAFALAKHASEVLEIPALVVFDALENVPGERVMIEGTTYTRSVGDLAAQGRLPDDHRLSLLNRLLTWASERAGVALEVRLYAMYQALPAVREGLHRIASRLDDFRPLVAPHDGIVRIRPRCPVCHLVEKRADRLRIISTDVGVRLCSSCPIHGEYMEEIDADGRGWYDANTPVRSILKGFLLSSEAVEHDACAVSVDGADWGGAWHAHVLAPALALFGIPPIQWPVSIFTPLVVDEFGGKLSKTLYVDRGAYGGVPLCFLDVEPLLEDNSLRLEALWNEASRWAVEPRRLHRSYSVDYFIQLLAERA